MKYTKHSALVQSCDTSMRMPSIRWMQTHTHKSSMVGVKPQLGSLHVLDARLPAAA